MRHRIQNFILHHFPALSERRVRLYAAGQLVLVVGQWSQGVGLNLTVHEQTGSTTILGLLNFLLYAPTLLVAPLAGGRIVPGRVKTQLRGTLMGNVLVSAALVSVLLLDLSFWLLFPLALLSGLFSAIEIPARLVLITSCTDRPELVSKAYGMNVLAVNLGRAIGAALGATVFATLGAPYTFVLFIAGLLVMFACVSAIDMKSAAGAKESAPGLRRALAYVKGDPFTALFLLVIALVSLFASSYPTIVPKLASDVFGNAAAYTGLFLTCGGSGAVASSLLVSSRWGELAGRRLVHVVPWCISAALAGLSVAPGTTLVGLLFFLLGASITFANTASSAVMLQKAPGPLRGGVSGLYAMAFAGLSPFGHLLAGWSADTLGVRGAFAALSIALTIALALLYLLLHGRARGQRG